MVFFQKQTNTTLMVSGKGLNIAIRQVRCRKPVISVLCTKRVCPSLTAASICSWSQAKKGAPKIDLLEPFGFDISMSINLVQRHLMAHETGTGLRETVTAEEVPA